MWTPPADQVVTDTGWRPPSDAVVSGDQSSSSTQPSNAGIEDFAQPLRDAGNYLANSSVGQAVGKASSVIGKAANVAAPLTAIVTPGSGIPELAQALSPQVAQKEGQIASDVGLKKGYPMTGAAVGTGIALTPDLINAYVGWKGLHDVPNPTVKGLLNTPHELSPEYGALDQSAGVSGKLPVQRGTIAKFPGLDGLPTNSPPVQAPNSSPLVYPKDTNTYLNFVRDRVDGLGEKLTPQELADHGTILSNIMAKMKSQGQSNTPVFAKAAQASSDITDLRNASIPGRADLNQAYGVASKQQALTDFIKKWSLGTGEVGAVGYGAKKAWDYFRK